MAHEDVNNQSVRLTERDVTFDDKGRAVVEKREATNFMREALRRRGEVFICEQEPTNQGCVNVVCFAEATA